MKLKKKEEKKKKKSACPIPGIFLCPFVLVDTLAFRASGQSALVFLLHNLLLYTKSFFKSKTNKLRTSTSYS